MENNNPFQVMSDWLDTEEGQKHLSEYASKIAKENEIREARIDKLYKDNKFTELTLKAKHKYNSDKYRDYWYNKGIEPPTPLYGLLLEYASKYGRECNTLEWNEYASIFTTELYFCEGFYLERMDGQGTVINVFKSLQNLINKIEDYDYKWTCPTCDIDVKVKEDVNGECPNCHRKYEWDFDGDYGEDSVYIPIWQDAPITQK